VDEQGKQVGVLLDIGDYRRILDALEELEVIRAYDVANASGDEAISFEQAIEEIERVDTRRAGEGGVSGGGMRGKNDGADLAPAFWAGGYVVESKNV